MSNHISAFGMPEKNNVLPSQKQAGRFTSNSTPTFKDFVDKENSKFTAAFYYREEWYCSHKKKDINGYNRYLKNIKDSAYDEANDAEQILMEFRKSITLLEEIATGSYVNNKLTTISIYDNRNKGGKILGENKKPIQNVIWCMLEIKRGAFVRNVNPYFEENNPKMAVILDELMEAWEEVIVRTKYLQY